MVRLAGTPAEIGRTLGAMNKKLIAHDLEVDYLRKAAAQKISEKVLLERAEAFVRIAEQIAPHWLEEARAVAQAADVSPDLYVAFLATRTRDLFLHECTSYAVFRDYTSGRAIFFHKNRDNTDRAQAAYVVASSVPGINKFITVGDVSRVACSMMVNDKGLAGSADYPVHFTRKGDPSALLPEASEPQYRGMMSGAILRYIAEKASNCSEALGIIQDFVKKGYYAGGKVNGQHWLFVDRTGAILEVSNNSQYVVSRSHTQKVYFSRSDNSAAAKRLRDAEQPIDFRLFHNVSRDPSICLKSSISGMSVEIDPTRPQTLTCAWVSFPARSVSFPLLMGQTKTPVSLANGEAYSLGKQTSGRRQVWEDVEQAAHASKERLKEKVLASSPRDEAKRAAELLDPWAQQQAGALLELLRPQGHAKQAGH